MSRSRAELEELLKLDRELEVKKRKLELELAITARYVKLQELRQKQLQQLADRRQAVLAQRMSPPQISAIADAAAGGRTSVKKRYG